MLVALIVVLVIVAVYAAALNNALVSLRRQTQLAFGQIDLQLKRRCEAIPGLVEQVKGQLANERDVLEKLMQARSEALNARSVIGKAAAETHLHRAIDSLFALAGADPDLALDDVLLSLQESFRTSQNKVTFASQYYNDAATAYNLRLEVFPSSLIASMRSLTPIDLFEFESAPSRTSAVVPTP